MSLTYQWYAELRHAVAQCVVMQPQEFCRAARSTDFPIGIC